MQKNFLNKFNRQILNIFILFSLILAIFIFVPQLNNKSYANNIYTYTQTYTYTKNSNDLPSDFENKYPGYKKLVEEIVNSHSNWIIKLCAIDLDWETIINNEYLGHGSSPKNLVPSNYADEWICSICGKKPYDKGNWYCASRGAIEYIMDPRNGINETYIFQFQDLSSTTGDRLSIEKMVSGTFINNTESIDAIFDASTTYNVSPYHLVSRIILEQGSEGNKLGTGITEDGVTYYNLFNIGAGGNSYDEIIQNGLNEAKKRGWTSMALSIKGGAETIVKNYISEGQNTVYFQKFNVVNCDMLYWHQYMQNVLAAQQEGLIIRNKYKDYGILDSSYTFLIPLYKNMPKSAIKNPTVIAYDGEIASINANGGLALMASPDAVQPLVYIDGGTQVIITKRATEKTKVIRDGVEHHYYMDQVYTPKGTGYMAREAEDGSKIYLVVMGHTNYLIKDEYIIIAPGTPIEKVAGAVNNSATFGTGAELTFEEKAYKLVVLGDTNGDGGISPADYVKIKNKIMGVTSLEPINEMSADVNQDGEITPADYVKVKNYIMSVSEISI